MSRIGRLPIPVPAGVDINEADSAVTVRGPRGEMSQVMPPSIRIVREDGTLLVQRDSDEPNVRALHGLIRSLLANMVTGVTTGFTKSLVINGVGYRATKDGNNLRLALGFSHPVEVAAPGSQNCSPARISRATVTVGTGRPLYLSASSLTARIR